MLVCAPAGRAPGSSAGVSRGNAPLLLPGRRAKCRHPSGQEPRALATRCDCRRAVSVRSRDCSPPPARPVHGRLRLARRGRGALAGRKLARGRAFSGRGPATTGFSGGTDHHHAPPHHQHYLAALCMNPRAGHRGSHCVSIVLDPPLPQPRICCTLLGNNCCVSRAADAPTRSLSARAAPQKARRRPVSAAGSHKRSGSGSSDWCAEGGVAPGVYRSLQFNMHTHIHRRMHSAIRFDTSAAGAVHQIAPATVASGPTAAAGPAAPVHWRRAGHQPRPSAAGRTQSGEQTKWHRM